MVKTLAAANFKRGTGGNRSDKTQYQNCKNHTRLLDLCAQENVDRRGNFIETLIRLCFLLSGVIFKFNRAENKKHLHIAYPVSKIHATKCGGSLRLAAQAVFFPFRHIESFGVVLIAQL